MRDIVADPNLVAYCGLYCGACRRFLGGKCPGCRENEKATWCKIRACCISEGLESCAACLGYKDVRQCGKFNNLISRFFALVFRSDRPACVAGIRAIGREAYAAEMAAKGLHAIRR